LSLKPYLTFVIDYPSDKVALFQALALLGRLGVEKDDVEVIKIEAS
jgi:hypothetical protein